MWQVEWGPPKMYVLPDTQNVTYSSECGIRVFADIIRVRISTAIVRDLAGP